MYFVKIIFFYLYLYFYIITIKYLLKMKRPDFCNKIAVNITCALQQQRGLSLAIFSPLKNEIVANYL